MELEALNISTEKGHLLVRRRSDKYHELIRAYTVHFTSTGNKVAHLKHQVLQDIVTLSSRIGIIDRPQRFDIDHEKSDGIKGSMLLHDTGHTLLIPFPVSCPCERVRIAEFEEHLRPHLALLFTGDESDTVVQQDRSADCHPYMHRECILQDDRKQQKNELGKHREKQCPDREQEGENILVPVQELNEEEDEQCTDEQQKVQTGELQSFRILDKSGELQHADNDISSDHRLCGNHEGSDDTPYDRV